MDSTSQIDYLEDFIIPENPLEIKHITYSDPKFRGDHFDEPESRHPPLVTAREVEDCLAVCTNVESIYISWDSGGVINAPPDESFVDIISVITSFGSKVKELSISSDSLLNEHMKLLNQDKLPIIEKLSFARCQRLGAEGIKNMASQCQNIKSLDLHYSLSHDANEAAFYIGEYLSNLKFLSVHRTCTIEDSGLRAIAEGCQNLEHIEAGRNYNLTDKSLEALGSYCKELKSIGMYYNNKVTEKGLNYLLKGCPNFRCFHHGSGWGVSGVSDVETKYPNACFSGDKDFCTHKS